MRERERERHEENKLQSFIGPDSVVKLSDNPMSALSLSLAIHTYPKGIKSFTVTLPCPQGAAAEAPAADDLRKMERKRRMKQICMRISLSPHRVSSFFPLASAYLVLKRGAREVGEFSDRPSRGTEVGEGGGKGERYGLSEEGPEMRARRERSERKESNNCWVSVFPPSDRSPGKNAQKCLSGGKKKTTFTSPKPAVPNTWL